MIFLPSMYAWKVLRTRPYSSGYYVYLNRFNAEYRDDEEPADGGGAEAWQSSSEQQSRDTIDKR